MIWKVLQRQIELQNVRLKGGKEDNDILIILQEDFVLGTYNEKLKSTWCNTQTQLGTFSPQELYKETWVIKFLRTSSMMRNTPKSKWLHWDKKWKIFVLSYKNIETTHTKTHDNPILTKKADTTLQGFATTAASTDTLETGVAEECETKKYDECNMICPSRRMLLLYGTAEVETLTVNSNTVKAGTDLRIRLMETTQPKDFSLLKKKPGRRELTS